jgi:hypothetical protein
MPARPCREGTGRDLTAEGVIGQGLIGVSCLASRDLHNCHAPHCFDEKKDGPQTRRHKQNLTPVVLALRPQTGYSVAPDTGRFGAGGPLLVQRSRVTEMQGSPSLNRYARMRRIHSQRIMSMPTVEIPGHLD